MPSVAQNNLNAINTLQNRKPIPIAKNSEALGELRYQESGIELSPGWKDDFEMEPEKGKSPIKLVVKEVELDDPSITGNGLGDAIKVFAR